MNPPAAGIARSLGSTLLSSSTVVGGCIHHTFRLDLADGRRIFVKSATGGRVPLLSAEASGLALLSPHLRVPQILGEGSLADGTRWLALEWLDLRPPDRACWEDLGRRLSALHSVTGSRHGLDHDNFIGSNPQHNTPADLWCEFYVEHRLRPQIRLARNNGHPIPEIEILGSAERLLSRHHPSPSLLHGDLWTGNFAAIAGPSAVVFDPAPYHGDPETDLAMLELFGGPLPSAFLEGYGAIPPDRLRRRPLYDLYHALNHLNLFGSGYLSMIRNLMEQLKAS